MLNKCINEKKLVFPRKLKQVFIPSVAFEFRKFFKRVCNSFLKPFTGRFREANSDFNSRTNNPPTSSTVRAENQKRGEKLYFCNEFSKEHLFTKIRVFLKEIINFTRGLTVRKIPIYYMRSQGFFFHVMFFFSKNSFFHLKSFFRENLASIT